MKAHAAEYRENKIISFSFEKLVPVSFSPILRIRIGSTIQHSRRISWQFCNDHLPQGKKTVYELHVFGFLSFLFLGRAGVIARVTIEPAVPRAIFKIFGLLGRDLAPFLAAFVLALHPHGHPLFFISWLRHNGGRGDSARVARLLQQSTLSFRHHSKGRQGLLNNSKW